MKREAEPVEPPTISHIEATQCRYCSCVVRRETMTDGRVLTVNPDGNSHWLTCKAVAASEWDDDEKGVANIYTPVGNQDVAHAS